MLLLSINFDLLLGSDTSTAHPNVLLLTIIFFALNFLAATQDIAVDGWALTILSRYALFDRHPLQVCTVWQALTILSRYALFDRHWLSSLGMHCLTGIDYPLQVCTVWQALTILSRYALFDRHWLSSPGMHCLTGIDYPLQVCTVWQALTILSRYALFDRHWLSSPGMHCLTGIDYPLQVRSLNKCYTQRCYLPISKLAIAYSIIAVAKLLAHNNKSQICYCGQISLQSVAVNSNYFDNLTPLGYHLFCW